MNYKEDTQCTYFQCYQPHNYLNALNQSPKWEPTQKNPLSSKQEYGIGRKLLWVSNKAHMLRPNDKQGKWEYM